MIQKVIRSGTELTGKPLYQVNDHWFRLNLKLVWNKDGKEETRAKTGGTVN